MRVSVRSWVQLGGLLVLAGGAACGTDNPGITPARDRFYFPTALALDPVRPILYVASSNADLQFNGSTLQALDLRLLPDDLGQIGAEVKAGKLTCQPGSLDATVWECPETQFVKVSATLRLGDYPSEIRVTSDGSRLLVPVRGQDYLLWADIVELAQGEVDLRCNSSRENGCGGVGRVDCPVWDCADDHKVSYSYDRRRTLPAEPFGLYLNELAAVHVDAQGGRRTCRDGTSAVACTCGTTPLCGGDRARACCIPAPPEDHVYVSHLSGGEVSFFTSNASGVQLRDIRSGFFEAVSDIRGAFSLAARTPGDPEGLVYVSSRVNSHLASFVIEDNDRIVDATRAPIGAISPGSDVRGLAFGPGGDRLYLVDRLPASLVAMDMALEDGLPRQQPLWAVELCSDPSVLQLTQNPLRPEDPTALLAYVVCFSAGQIYVIDTTLTKVVAQIMTGKGPNVLVLDPAHRRGFVANFLDNTVGIIDLDPAHRDYQRMVMRIGKVEQLTHN